MERLEQAEFGVERRRSGNETREFPLERLAAVQPARGRRRRRCRRRCWRCCRRRVPRQAQDELCPNIHRLALHAPEDARSGRDSWPSYPKQ